MSFTAGLLMATGVGHTVVGLVLFRDPVAVILRDGLLNSIHYPQFDRAAAFWFLLFSPVLFALGQITDHAVRRGDGVTLRIIGRYLLVIGVVGALIIPLSGFWLVIGIAAIVLHAARQSTAKAGTAAVLPAR